MKLAKGIGTISKSLLHKLIMIKVEKDRYLRFRQCLLLEYEYEILLFEELYKKEFNKEEKGDYSI